MTPTATTSPNALRQPSAWPSHDAIGTPRTVATVRPVMTCATALARFCGPIRCAATSAATPKNAPCGRPATKRAAISVPYDGASTLARLPRVNTAISPSSSVLRVMPRGQRGDEWCADDDTERVCRNDMAGGGFGDTQARRRYRAAGPWRRTRWCRSRTRQGPVRAPPASAPTAPARRPRRGWSGDRGKRSLGVGPSHRGRLDDLRGAAAGRR